MKKYLMIMMAGLFLALPANAADFQKGLEAYERGDYKTARDEFMPLAEAGDDSAQILLGWMYEHGQGVDPEPSEADKWYNRAVGQRDSVAQFFLDSIRNKGQGVDSDYTDSVKWHRIAAETGEAEAQYSIGEIYKQNQDYDRAFEWYLRAAKQDHAGAQYNLGVMYEKNRGKVPRGNSKVQNDTKAFDWYRKAAEQNNAIAQYNLGVMYEEGRGTKKNCGEAAEWYGKAAKDKENEEKEIVEKGIVSAQYNLGVMYEKGCEGGKNVPKDDEAAFEWYSKAADQNHASAQNNLGRMYEQVLGVDPPPKDEPNKYYAEVFTLYKSAAKQGNPDAQNNLGVIYEQARGGVHEDFDSAFVWYSIAISNGHTKAVEWLKSIKGKIRLEGSTLDSAKETLGKCKKPDYVDCPYPT